MNQIQFGEGDQVLIKLESGLLAEAEVIGTSPDRIGCILVKTCEDNQVFEVRSRSCRPNPKFHRVKVKFLTEAMHTMTMGGVTTTLSMGGVISYNKGSIHLMNIVVDDGDVRGVYLDAAKGTLSLASPY